MRIAFVTDIHSGHGPLVRSDFTPVFAVHVGLAILTALLCLPVNTRPGAPKGA